MKCDGAGMRIQPQQECIHAYSRVYYHVVDADPAIRLTPSTRRAPRIQNGLISSESAVTAMVYW